jgi:putative NADH-flavin reductase
MKLAIFGVTGGVGREVLAQALGAHHEVRALARNPSKLGPEIPSLSMRAGDVRDAAAVADVIAGTDAVICALGAKPSDPTDTCSLGTTNIIAGMKLHNVKRLAVVTGCMVGHPPELMQGWVYKLIRLLEIGPMKRMMMDRRAQEAVVKSSDLDWTIVRPPRLLDGPKTGVYQIGADLVIGTKAGIRRADVAEILLKSVTTNQFVRQGVAVNSGV